MEGRSRRSRGSLEWHTAQWQPMVGTPTLVPEPSTVMLRESAGITHCNFGRRGGDPRVLGLAPGKRTIMSAVLRSLLIAIFAASVFAQSIPRPEHPQPQ